VDVSGIAFISLNDFSGSGSVIARVNPSTGAYEVSTTNTENTLFIGGSSVGINGSLSLVSGSILKDRITCLPMGINFKSWNEALVESEGFWGSPSGSVGGFCIGDGGMATSLNDAEDASHTYAWGECGEVHSATTEEWAVPPNHNTIGVQGPVTTILASPSSSNGLCRRLKEANQYSGDLNWPVCFRFCRISENIIVSLGSLVNTESSCTPDSGTVNITSTVVLKQRGKCPITSEHLPKKNRHIGKTVGTVVGVVCLCLCCCAGVIFSKEEPSYTPMPSNREPLRPESPEFLGEVTETTTRQYKDKHGNVVTTTSKQHRKVYG